ncbi:MAG: PBP1A family penicillin-binding protein, partial [Gemmatimonadota bacterium]|nr:PBP1A family penicillin-binding protein [Gemmatimonadota bacterium]
MQLRWPGKTKPRTAVAVALGVLAGLLAASTGWYGYRVKTELSPGSWRSPTQILDRNGKTLVALYGSDWRVAEPVTLGDLPKHVPNAFLAAEDTRFRSHFGIDPIGIGRALVSNVKAGGVTEGGSTVTQQLAKMRFLSADRTFGRKLAEIPLSMMIELRLSKDEILEAYLNEVYLGHRDGREVRGLGEGARVYFGKTPAKLTAAEAALIAGMIRAPNRDNPDERAKIATQRRNAVLAVMLEKKWIDKQQYDAAVASDAEFRPGSRRLRPHPFLIAAVRQELIDKVGERSLHTGGLKIHTPVDRQMQIGAEASVRSGAINLRRSHKWLQRKKPLQAALLSVDPRTGGIRALVGGSDFRRSQFDRTRLMRRQLGSAAKPFTYAAAIASRNITPATVVQDQPIQITLASSKVWQPKNYDDQFRGAVTVREAFEKSLNVPAVRVAQQVGVERVRDVLNEAGIGGNLSETPAIALGVDDVSMREVVAAYSMFPNLGPRSEPHVIDRVEKRGGGEVYRYEPQLTDALDPAVAYVIHSMMRGVVMRGTASRLQGLGLGYVAGKTGTTSNYRDAWFVGYSPDLLTAVWVGFDDGTPLRMSSGEAAVPIWASFMRRAPHARAELAPPGGVTAVEVEAMSGRVWEPGSGPSVVEIFLTGTEPRERCGGFYEGTYVLEGYEEPMMLTEEQ